MRIWLHKEAIICKSYRATRYEPGGIDACDAVEQKISDLQAEIDAGEKNEYSEYELFEQAAEFVHGGPDDE